ncbi:hypothetical protein ZWY2020_006650 [Hordeum vulgare]|nr:hypothetical protein ZWY2020_006650 [Hordeum vulgare]
MTLDDYPEEKKGIWPSSKASETAVKKFHESSFLASSLLIPQDETSSSDSSTKVYASKAKLQNPRKVCRAWSPNPRLQNPRFQNRPPKPSAPKPSAPIAPTPKSSAPPPKPVQKKVVQTTTASSSSSLPAATSSETKSSTPHVKTLATTEPAPLPSPSKIITVPSTSEGSEEYDDETLEAIIRNKQERVAQASGSAIPLAMEPKVLLDFINVWYEDPNTPIDDLKLPPGVNHMVATFINEAKWKEQKAK